MSELAGKVCLVTGGAGHIGRAICQVLLDEGAEVVAVGRRAPSEPITSNAASASFYAADIRDPNASQVTQPTDAWCCGNCARWRVYARG